VLAGRAVAVAGPEHADELAHQFVVVEQAHRRPRGHRRAVLDDREMPRAEGRDLGQVGDAQDLPAIGELAQMLADRPLAMEEPVPALTALTNRVVSYLER